MYFHLHPFGPRDQIEAECECVARENLRKPGLIPGHNANKSNADRSDLLGPYRPSCAALNMSTRSAISTGHFLFTLGQLLQQPFAEISKNERKIILYFFLLTECYPTSF